MVKKLLSHPLVNETNAFRLLTAMHLAGVIGLALPETQLLFMQLTPFNLLVSAAIVFHFQENKTRQYFLFIPLVMALGFLVEVIGVSTGTVFGEYRYGATLGFQLWDVPLVIGVNWALLIYVSGNFAAQLTKNLWLKSALGAFVMTALDVAIEPVAITYDFWSWNDHEIPMQNYVAWFLVSFVLHLLFQLLKFEKNNLLAVRLLYLQVLFFLVLNFV